MNFNKKCYNYCSYRSHMQLVLGLCSLWFMLVQGNLQGYMQYILCIRLVFFVVYAGSGQPTRIHAVRSVYQACDLCGLCWFRATYKDTCSTFCVLGLCSLWFMLVQGNLQGYMQHVLCIRLVFFVVYAGSGQPTRIHAARSVYQACVLCGLCWFRATYKDTCSTFCVLGLCSLWFMLVQGNLQGYMQYILCIRLVFFVVYAGSGQPTRIHAVRSVYQACVLCGLCWFRATYKDTCSTFCVLGLCSLWFMLVQGNLQGYMQYILCIRLVFFVVYAGSGQPTRIHAVHSVYQACVLCGLCWFRATYKDTCSTFCVLGLCSLWFMLVQGNLQGYMQYILCIRLVFFVVYAGSGQPTRIHAVRSVYQACVLCGLCWFRATYKDTCSTFCVLGLCSLWFMLVQGNLQGYMQYVLCIRLVIFVVYAGSGQPTRIHAVHSVYQACVLCGLCWFRATYKDTCSTFCVLGLCSLWFMLVQGNLQGYMQYILCIRLVFFVVYAGSGQPTRIHAVHSVYQACVLCGLCWFRATYKYTCSTFCVLGLCSLWFMLVQGNLQGYMQYILCIRLVFFVVYAGSGQPTRIHAVHSVYQACVLCGLCWFRATYKDTCSTFCVLGLCSLWFMLVQGNLQGYMQYILCIRLVFFVVYAGSGQPTRIHAVRSVYQACVLCGLCWFRATYKDTCSTFCVLGLCSLWFMLVQGNLQGYMQYVLCIRLVFFVVYAGSGQPTRIHAVRSVYQACDLCGLCWFRATYKDTCSTFCVLGLCSLWFMLVQGNLQGYMQYVLCIRLVFFVVYAGSGQPTRIHAVRSVYQACVLCGLCWFSDLESYADRARIHTIRSPAAAIV